MPLRVAEIGSFFVGGRIVNVKGLPSRITRFTPDAPPVTIESDGDFAAFAMYVQFVKLERPRCSRPIALWHGGSLTGSVWERTPDGRAGWQMFFLEAGYDVYVSDAVERGRSGWSRWPEIFTSEPLFRSHAEAWKLFRIDAASAFPRESFDELAKSFAPRFTSNDRAALDAYLAFLERVGRAIVVGHSQGAGYALSAASLAPDRMAAVVALEPSAVPSDGAAFAAAAQVPHLFVWGDGVEGDPFWRPLEARARAYHERLLALGSDSTYITLPERGVRGSSHMLMSDRTSDAVAGEIEAWLRSRSLG